MALFKIIFPIVVAVNFDLGEGFILRNGIHSCTYKLAKQQALNNSERVICKHSANSVHSEPKVKAINACQNTGKLSIV
jgi:hypothetical protein